MSHPSLQELTQAVHGLGPTPDHLALCADCQETVDRLRAERDVLRRADVRLDVPLPKRKLGGRVLVALAAAVLLAVTAAIVLRREPLPAASPAPSVQEKPDVDKLIARFLEGTEKDSAQARELLLASASAALPALVEIRLERPDVLRPDALSTLILDLKRKLAGPAADPIFKRLMEARLEVEAKNMPMADVLEFVAKTAQVGVHLDPQDENILLSLKVKDATALQGLDLFRLLHRREFDVRFGILLVGQPDRLFDLPSWRQAPNRSVIPTQGHWRRQELTPAGADLLKKLDRMAVDLEFTNTSFADVIAFIRDFSETNLILQPDSSDLKTTVKVKGLPVASVLELLFLPRGRDLKIEGNTVIIFARN
jgi:hypothetical protein